MSSLVLKPRMTEKTYALSANHVYVFDVPLKTNKTEVAAAVADEFKVTVKDVRLMINKGKKARSIRIGGKYRSMVYGKRSDVKKAYVTVAESDVIPIFAAIEEAEKKQAKAEEKLAKKAKKESK